MKLTILTASKLAHLATFYPALHDTWYIVACACLAAVNRPHEIPSVVHFALHRHPLCPSSLSESAIHQLAADLILLAKNAQDLSIDGKPIPDIIASSENGTPTDFKALQQSIMQKSREVLLKGAALNGLPKSINALSILLSATPHLLRPSSEPLRPSVVSPQPLPEANTRSTIDGYVGPDQVDSAILSDQLVRGLCFWDTVYSNKINKRVKNQLVNAYPDLWQFTFQHVYTPLLSFTDVLLPRETLICIVASLIPQDVNPQLKGHLRGALNNGSSKDEMDAVREMVFQICDWTGAEYWAGGKQSVARL